MMSLVASLFPVLFTALHQSLEVSLSIFILRLRSPISYLIGDRPRSNIFNIFVAEAKKEDINQELDEPLGHQNIIKSYSARR
ncbi:hypothetical protein RIR_jg10308.t1 [Rhizophagus irregularis DAOM 181602=DAOM 197198]|nr:hypothetical protein RIR_jg10308.t1 [Rhizophagus irregularis DAOM 181602=DAOM 197198]